MAALIALLGLSLWSKPILGQTLSTVTAPGGCGASSTTAGDIPSNSPVSLPTTGAGAATSLPSNPPTITTIPIPASGTTGNSPNTCSPIPYQTGSNYPPNYSLNFQDGMLGRHNYLRQFHGSSTPMTWNSDLAAAAQNEVNTCIFAHTPNNPYGENLAGMQQTGGYTANQLVVAVDEWYAEISAYNFSQPGFSSATGHFTQVVWLGSTQLGCAWKDCTNSPAAPATPLGLFFVACEYAPQGNIVNSGYFEANVLPPVAEVSSCQGGTTSNPGRKGKRAEKEAAKGWFRGRRMARELPAF